MIRITKDLNAEVVEIGDPERTGENPHKITCKRLGTK